MSLVDVIYIKVDVVRGENLKHATIIVFAIMWINTTLINILLLFREM